MNYEKANQFRIKSKVAIEVISLQTAPLSNME